MITRSSKQLVAEANALVEAIPPETAAKLVGAPNVVFVDVRDPSEVAKAGTIKGAVRVPRGLLEFHADPNSPMHAKPLSSGKRLVLFCASGGRSALAAKTLKDMGIENVAHVPGGFPALKDAGAQIDD